MLRNIRWSLIGVILVVIQLINTNLASSKTIFVDPSIREEQKQLGTEELPYNELNKLLRAKVITSGDVVILKPGKYKPLDVINQKFTKPVSIISKEKWGVKLPYVRVKNSSNVLLFGFTVSPEFGKLDGTRNLVDVRNGSSNIVIDSFNIYTVKDTHNWDKKDWGIKAYSGVFTAGKSVDVIRSKIKNVMFGISSNAPNSKIVENLIENFSGDGMRGNGDYTLFERNIVKNCLQVDDNHADGFQAWSTGKDGKVGTGELTGITLRGNWFLNYEDENQKYKCHLQGIGLFDGTYVDWVIENNVLIVDHYHGITVMGAKNVKILNNTVFDPTGKKPGPAWIRITKHKNGKASSGNVVANNLAHSYSFPDGGVLQLQNQIIRNPYALFEDPDNLDFRLKPGSRAIDAGMNGLGVMDDFFGNPRPSGEKIDVGAIEFQQ